MDILPENPVLKFHPDTLEAVRKMFDMDKNKLVQSIDLLEEWAKKQSHFVVKNYSRAYFERKIIASKGSVEKAKSSHDKLCTLKTLCPKYFICQDLKEKTKGCYDVICSMHLPVMTEDYQRVYFVRMYDAPFTAANFIEFYRFNVLIAEYELLHDYPCGFIFLFDMRDVNLMDILNKINLIELQQFVSIIIEGYGARVTGVHFVNQSKLIEMFLKVIKPVLPPKIANRVHGHQSLESLYKVLDKKLLPSDLGGDQKSVREIQAQWIDAMTSEKHQKYIEEMIQMRTDEALRQTDKFNEQCMGLPGSFRTLTVD